MIKVDVVIVGAGQAGLATSYYLSQHGVEHIILEADDVAATWQKKRWDSFTLVTPNRMNTLPGANPVSSDPERFLTKDEVIQYLQAYAQDIAAPVKRGVRVDSVLANNDGFLLQTTEGQYQARQVVIATSIFNVPSIPGCAANLPVSITQMHSEDYRNPQQLPKGGVLVVGAAQSGAQIAEELLDAGREVFLSVGDAGRLPRRYRGKDITQWMALMGLPDMPSPSLSESAGRFPANPHMSGKDGGHEINLWELAKNGMHLLGRVDSVRGNVLYCGGNLLASLQHADDFYQNWITKIDGYIADNHLELESEVLVDHRFDLKEVMELDISEANITSVVWATGYRFDYSWVQCDCFDDYGYPRATQGVSTQPGLYFVGLHGSYKIKSGLIVGVGELAQHVAEAINNFSQ